ncbi:MAG: DUF2092 domain-containing protein [Betaproteobacteria bacterium]|nr:DUF2092 domain-containing protein [Betaproteobacteria bacterium]
MEAPKSRLWRALLVAVSLALAGNGYAASSQPAKKPSAAKSAKAKSAAKPAAAAQVKPVIEAKAVDLLKAASARLAAAKSMSFTAIVSYEHPSRYGPALVYTTKSDVALLRPDKLRVITYGDGPPSEFYYNGKTMMAFAPVENLVAVADAPPTVDAMLKAAFDSASIYFPFTDFIVTDPYKDIAEGLELAFYIGQSNIVGGVTTDMVAYVSGGVFVQAWIGAEDKLPRRVRAVYLADPLQLRHEMELSNWQLDSPVATEFFESAKAANANRISFGSPQLPAVTKQLPTNPVKTSPAKKP